MIFSNTPVIRTLLFLFILFPGIAFAQLTEFTDDFEDGSLDTTWNGELHTLWESNSEEIYSLNEQNGVLEIEYNRTSQTGSTIALNLPEPMDISDNPRVKLTVKSSVSFSLTLISFFQISPPVPNFSVQEIPGDDEWHTYIFELDESKAQSQTLKWLTFYFDREYDGNKSGLVLFDNLSISGTIIEVVDVEAATVDNSSIQLNWNSTDPEGTAIYKIYRSTEQGFVPGPETFITNTGLTSFLNTGLENNTPYYFRILPVDTLGIEQVISKEIRQETYTQGVLPTVTVDEVISSEFKTYEKVELLLSLENVIYDNPYNPEDIDLRANFISPDDDTVRFYGFYDNYQNRDQWKIRFAPTVPGTWTYEVYAIDTPGQGEVTSGTFEATASDHPGYVQISDENPNYLKRSEGEFFYPMAVYYPWSVNTNQLNRLQNYEIDFFGYWNGTYDNAGNGGGNRLLESMDSGLGRYDQHKSARLDQLVEWAEERNMHIMYAIWAHPFVRHGAPNWEPHDWFPHNPYQEIIDVSEFYTDSLAWSYQKKNFRYVVARWGYSRALGIWEIMNEIHGTTGYVANSFAAEEWTNKAHDLLKELDPYDRPTTASYGGTAAWNVNNVKPDMPNRHYYEGQGYPRPYGDDIRDGLYNVVEVYKSLKQTKNRPAFLGEAGYHTMFSESSSDDYTYEFHNAHWAGLVNGIASTPFWWDFTTSSIFTDTRMEKYGIIKKFIDPLNLAHVPVEQKTLLVPGSNAYAMGTDTMAFGWFWSYQHENISGLDVTLRGLNTHSYKNTWYNTWTGDTVKVENVVSIESVLESETPEINHNRQDIAFRIQQIENGTEATRLNILFHEIIVPITGDPKAHFKFAVYITDDENRLVNISGKEISLSLEGEGTLGQTSVTTENGFAMIDYIQGSSDELNFTITASAEDLASAVFNDQMITSNEEDEQQEIPTGFSLQQNYPNPFNPTTVISYQLLVNSDVSLKVFDMLGKEVATLVDGKNAAGEYQVTFNAAGLSSGVYFYKLQAGDFEQVKQMVLIK